MKTIFRLLAASLPLITADAVGAEFTDAKSQQKIAGDGLADPGKETGGGDNKADFSATNKDRVNSEWVDKSKDFNLKLRKLSKNLDSLENERVDLMKTMIFRKSENSRLDFSDDHEKMLSKYTEAGDLLKRYNLHAEYFRALQEVGNKIVIPTNETSEGAAMMRTAKDELAEGLKRCEDGAEADPKVRPRKS